MKLGASWSGLLKTLKWLVRAPMRAPAGRSCRSSQSVILSRSGTNLRWRGQRRDRSDRRQRILAGTYRFECLPEGEGGPLVSSNKPPEFNVEMIGRKKERLGLGRACLGRVRGSQPSAESGSN